MCKQLSGVVFILDFKDYNTVNPLYLASLLFSVFTF